MQLISRGLAFKFHHVPGLSLEVSWAFKRKKLSVVINVIVLMFYLLPKYVCSLVFRLLNPGMLGIGRVSAFTYNHMLNRNSVKVKNLFCLVDKFMGIFEVGLDVT